MYDTLNNSSIFGSLIKLSKSKKEFRVLNGKDVLWFPIQIPQNVSLIEMLNNSLSNYIKLLSASKEIIGEVGDIICIVSDVSKRLIEVLNHYRNGDIIESFEVFSRMMDDKYNNCLPIKKVESNIILYRMRSKTDIKEKEEFYYLPVSMRHKCSSERFSIAGYPCLYLGYSKKDCMTEVSNIGSIIGLSLKENVNINVLDLAFYYQQKERKDFVNYLKAWPLIAACYMVQCNERAKDASFKEEYIIPQMLTAYLKHKYNELNIDGICYYSVRNENLNPQGEGEVDYRNLVLFPYNNDVNEENGTNRYELCDRFEWYQPFNVGK